MKDLYTRDELAAIITTVVAGIRTGDNGDDRVYPLHVVAERTGWALTTLEEETRAGTLEHTGKGRAVGMTSRQIALAVAKYRRGKTDLTPQQTEEDELAQVRQATRSGAAGRKRPRRQKVPA